MITVKQYSNDVEKWDAFVHSANNGTIFHTHKFLNYHPKSRFVDHSLLFYKDEKLISVFPAAAIEKNGQRLLVSHPGASMGSLVVPEDLSFADAHDIVERLLNHARNEGFDTVQITQPPTIYSRRLSHYIDFALRTQGFQYLKREVSSVLFLENDMEKVLNKFKPTHRTAVRKAERSRIIVHMSDDYQAFYSILSKNLSIRHNVTPTHTLDELLKLKNIYPQNIHLFGAFLEKRMVAGVVNFIANQNVVLAFYISHDETYQMYRPINLLFYKIFEWAIENRYSIFDFGIFTINEKPNMGLARFKENFGASGQFRDTMELVLH